MVVGAAGFGLRVQCHDGEGSDRRARAWAGTGRVEAASRGRGSGGEGRGCAPGARRFPGRLPTGGRRRQFVRPVSICSSCPPIAVALAPACVSQRRCSLRSGPRMGPRRSASRCRPTSWVPPSSPAAWPAAPLETLVAAVRAEGAFVNAASSEEGSGSPSRGGLPDTRARRTADGYRVTGEKTFTTWLPALRYALVSARVVEDERAKSNRSQRPTS